MCCSSRKNAVKSLDELSAEDSPLCSHLLLTVPKIAGLLGLSGGYRTVINTGAHGGQTVFHLLFISFGARD